MGLKCSLLGHAYGEPEVRRDREERGDEVVVTVREVQTCTRCGDESVVSENTEVRSVKPDPREETADTASGWDDADADTAGFAGVDDEFDDVDPGADDAVILEDDPEAPERAHGEWPDADDTNATSPAETAAETSADEASTSDSDASTETATDASVDDASDGEPTGGNDGDILVAGEESATTESATESESDSTTETEAGAETATGEWPEANVRAETADEAGAASRDWPDADVRNADDAAASAFDAGFETQGRTDADGQHSSPIESSSADVDVDAELVCPACGFRETALGSSHRAGDICPECRTGYLATN